MVAKARMNNIVHRGGVRDNGNAPLYELAESLYFLVVFCLLRECGVEDDVFEGIQQRQRFITLQKELSDI